MEKKKKIADRLIDLGCLASVLRVCEHNNEERRFEFVRRFVCIEAVRVDGQMSAEADEMRTSLEAALRLLVLPSNNFFFFCFV